MPYATCPGCDENIFVSARLREGDTVRCSHCDAELEVVSTSPLELDWPFYEEETEDEWDADDEEEEDDWDYDDDEDEEQ
jgi:hypothetical protein